MNKNSENKNKFLNKKTNNPNNNNKNNKENKKNPQDLKKINPFKEIEELFNKARDIYNKQVNSFLIKVRKI